MKGLGVVQVHGVTWRDLAKLLYAQKYPVEVTVCNLLLLH